MRKLGIIYVATDTARDDRQYVGQTVQTLKRRKRGRYNSYFQNAINHHGDKIEWKVVGEFPIEELDVIERNYIQELNTIYPNGYNFETGGSKNKIVLKETRKKMSEAKTGKRCHMYGKHHSEETKRKIGEAQTGEKHHMYGKHHSPKSIQKISEANKGEKNYRAKLTWKIVKEIREKYTTGKYTYKLLAKEYGVGKSQIFRIINNKCWIEQ